MSETVQPYQPVVVTSAPGTARVASDADGRPALRTTDAGVADTLDEIRLLLVRAVQLLEEK